VDCFNGRPDSTCDLGEQKPIHKVQVKLKCNGAGDVYNAGTGSSFDCDYGQLLFLELRDLQPAL
jgi:hypothetical protein